MKNRTSGFLKVASIALALALTISCSSDGDSKSSYSGFWYGTSISCNEAINIGSNNIHNYGPKEKFEDIKLIGTYIDSGTKMSIQDVKVFLEQYSSVSDDDLAKIEEGRIMMFYVSNSDYAYNCIVGYVERE